MDRQCFEVRIKNCEFFILVARHRYIFYICALAIHWLFRSEKNDHETVSPRRSEWQNTTNEAPRKMSKGNYERYKFLTSVYFSFIRFERGESIVKSETNTRPFLY